MKTEIIDITDHPYKLPAVEAKLSFSPFVNYFKGLINEADPHRNHFYQYVIAAFEKHPELLNGIDVHEVHKYPGLLQMVFDTLIPIAENESDQLWGLSMPINPLIFYSTDNFYEMAQKVLQGNYTNPMVEKGHDEMIQYKSLVIYSFILERFYGIERFLPHDVVHTIVDQQTGLQKFYKQHLDQRFIDVLHMQELPTFDIGWLKSLLHDKKAALDFLTEKLPLDNFQIEGFTITSIIDITASHTIESIKDMMLHQNSNETVDDYSKYIYALKTMIGTNDVEFGLLPIMEMNGKLVFNSNSCNNSALAQLSSHENNIDELYKSMLESYFKDPKLVFFSNINEKQDDPCLKELADYGVIASAIVPVYFNKTLVGVLDLYTKKKGVMAEDLLAKLEPAIPLLSQLMKNSIDNFNAEIGRIITEKFTSLQPVVQWKFNEVALNYLHSAQNGGYETEEIFFDNVYPLYGAVDIRNSTVERNRALLQDLQQQFIVLINVLQQLKFISGFSLLDEKIFTSKRWLEKISSTENFTEEIKLNDFLDNDILPFLKQFTEGSPEYNQIVSSYYRAIDENTGIANENRRQLENSMTTVISAVNKYFDSFKDEIQKAYPSYFEKFRTDGVEYDIYIGQSLTLNKPYNPIYLKNLRLLQLTSMATISKFTHAMLDNLEKHVETTQLIFIHSQPINIKFRKDEKRFDVEGAYNIRYHIIKKRIDKVRIKQTNERLTQPNKIALVYFSQKEAEEYISYIRYLQGENILLNDLEYLELEELQGVSGLKALRVGVHVEE